VTALLAFVLADRRDEFTAALQTAPMLILLGAAALQLLALMARTEAWHVSVAAAGATIGRRRLYRAASMGYLGSQLNSQLGAAARIAALRRSGGDRCPRVPALVAAEIPILTVEVVLVALFSFTLVAPLGLPWWLPIVLFAVALAILAGVAGAASRWRKGFFSGLAVLRNMRGRTAVIGFVLIAVLAQVGRNWMMLHAVGVDASVLDAIAVLIALVVLSQLPIGPSVGAAAVVGVLGGDGVAMAAAAGVLLTVTGTAGALGYAAWAGLDRLWTLRPVPTASVRPQPAAGATRG
jgi:uncharacterized membrane protein YbhN (UPF0104 family)